MMCITYVTPFRTKLGSNRETQLTWWPADRWAAGGMSRPSGPRPTQFGRGPSVPQSIGAAEMTSVPDRPNRSGWYISSTLAGGAVTVPAARTRARYRMV